MRPQSCWLSHVVILSFLTNSEHCGGNASTNMQHLQQLQQLQPRHGMTQLKQNTRKSDHLLDFLSQHMRPQSCWLSHVVILSFLTNSEHCGGNANTNMQHLQQLQQLQPRHALAQLKQNTRKSDHLLDFLSQHMRPQSRWLSHVVILSFLTNSEECCGHAMTRQCKHATSATTTTKTCNSSTQAKQGNQTICWIFYLSICALSHAG